MLRVVDVPPLRRALEDANGALREELDGIYAASLASHAAQAQGGGGEGGSGASALSASRSSAM